MGKTRKMTFLGRGDTKRHTAPCPLARLSGAWPAKDIVGFAGQHVRTTVSYPARLTMINQLTAAP